MGPLRTPREEANAIPLPPAGDPHGTEKTRLAIAAAIENARAEGAAAVDAAVVRVIGNLTTDGLTLEVLDDALKRLGISNELFNRKRAESLESEG